MRPLQRRPCPRPSRCGGNGALVGKNRAVCIPFSPNARKRPPPWQYLREMHAFRDQDGKILALCVHFRAQSGDSGCMARESCHQGPLSASRARKSYMTRRCCQRCPTFRGASPRVAGPRTGRTGFAPCGLGLVHLPHARVSAISSVPPLLAPGVRHPSLPFVRPRRIHRCRHSRGRIHCRRPSRRARRAHHAASPATPPVTSFIAVGGGWRAAATRARDPPPIAAIRPRAPRLHACQAAVTRRVVHCGRGRTADRALPAHTRLASPIATRARLPPLRRAGSVNLPHFR